MIRCRPLDWPRDRAALARLDSSFTTHVVYDVTAGPLDFVLTERHIDPPLRKCYDVAWDELSNATFAVIAERDGDVVGATAAELHSWNRRMVVSHLYVDRDARRSGVGAALVRAVREHAESLRARCLWAETQNVNAPAIRFYRRQGFACCGLDTTLYDPRQVPGEVAVFFALALDG